MKLPETKLFKKSFVSLVITPTKIQAIKLNGGKNKAEIFAESEITPGVISSYRVKDSVELAAQIKALWKKSRIREKFVGVVVPEFSTYTKTITLPNLTDTEIQEALNWQLQEFLPAPVDEVVADWKIIRREKEQVQILVVAILKNVLFGYIDAVGSAGLSPLVVETPSISIERITNDNAVGKMVIYISMPEALLTITQGQRIVASSVVAAQSMNIVVNTALQMMNHYKEVKVDKILIGGIGISQELVENLHYNLGTTVQLLNIKLAGMSHPQVQNFLLGISLQHKNPAEPASEETINLLPPHWAEHYRDKLSNIQAWTMSLVISIIVWTSFIASFAVYMLIGLQAEELTSNGAGEAIAGLNSAIARVNSVNKNSERLISLSEKIYPFQSIVNSINEQKPEAIRILDYKINMENGLVQIFGISPDRTALLEFRDKMEENSSFSNVDVPIGQLLQETNVNFEMTTIYSELFVEKKPNIKLKL